MRFPIARRLWRLFQNFRTHWIPRHRHPVNYWLHMLGIPAALLGILLLPVLPWEWCLGLFLGGYFVQWVGHKIEGNDVGELIPIKRALGLRVVAIAPERV
jgi:hypothetical protein